MSTSLATMPDAEAIEQVLVNGDLARLTPLQRVSYYNRVCQSLGLNPLTKPFDYINLNGKLVLYAKRDATEQLRKMHGVSIRIVGWELVEDCYIVSAQAQLPNERVDESIGAVPLAGLKGEARANAMMKAETKAKRRVTLSICGLGLLDETEVDSIHPETRPVVVPDPPMTVLNAATGEDVPASERPEAPAGFHFIDGYRLNGEWHEFHLLHFDAQGGSFKFSTKRDAIGNLVAQAYQQGVPIRVDDFTPKKQTKGEGYVNKLTVYKPPPSDADIDAELARQELARQAGEVL